MKKLVLLILGVGFFAVSCSTKEKQMSSSETDSTMTDTPMQTAPAVSDTMSTTMPMDSMKVDSTAAPAGR